MGFKSMSSYNDEKYGNFFRLQNDGDYADVILLYRSTADVMMADTHYIKSNTYSGYVTCCGKGCPACAKQVRIQPKLFVPMYVLNTTDPNGIIGRIQFWDRTMRFQPQLLTDVFKGYPNPSEFIFRITRHGMAGDINTTYDIRAIQNNSNPATSYDAICSQFGAVFPDYFNLICKDVDMFELGAMMTEADSPSGSYGNNYSGNNYGNGGYGANNNFGATPRGGSTPIPGSGTTIPGTEIPYTGQDVPNLSTPNVPINSRVPDAAPDPSDLPFSEGDSSQGAEGSTSESDPLQTNEDIDTTNLDF